MIKIYTNEQTALPFFVVVDVDTFDVAVVVVRSTVGVDIVELQTF